MSPARLWPVALICLCLFALSCESTPKRDPEPDRPNTPQPEPAPKINYIDMYTPPRVDARYAETSGWWWAFLDSYGVAKAMQQVVSSTPDPTHPLGVPIRPEFAPERPRRPSWLTLPTKDKDSIHYQCQAHARPQFDKYHSFISEDTWSQMESNNVGAFTKHWRDLRFGKDQTLVGPYALAWKADHSEKYGRKCLQGMKDGDLHYVPHGLCKVYYHESGSQLVTDDRLLMAQGHFYHGRQVGAWKYYGYENGTTQYQSFIRTYYFDSPDGPVFAFATPGAGGHPVSGEFYEMGKRKGPRVLFNAAGSASGLVDYNADETGGSFCNYNEAGLRTIAGELRKSGDGYLVEGLGELWDHDGAHLRIAQLSQSQENGWTTNYGPDGLRRNDRQVVNQVWQGWGIQYHNGHMKYLIHAKDGKASGEGRVYNSDGSFSTMRLTADGTGNFDLLGQYGPDGLRLDVPADQQTALAPWTRREPEDEDRPEGRSFAAMAHVPGTGVFLFGGHDGDLPLGDLWLWDGSVWSEIEVRGETPEPRSQTALAYDPQAKRLVLFGGKGESGELNDTWLFDPAKATWQRLYVECEPEARLGHAMVYDPRRKCMLLMGGGQVHGTGLNVGYGYCMDSWSFDGVSWRQEVDHKAPNTLWPAACYDPVGGVFAHGGISIADGKPNFGTQLLGPDGWESGGMFVGEGRDLYRHSRHGAVYHAGRGEVALLDFENGKLHWRQRDGNVWRLREGPEGFPRAAGGCAVYDSDRNCVVCFGGYQMDQFGDITARLHDIYELPLAAGATVPKAEKLPVIPSPKVLPTFALDRASPFAPQSSGRLLLSLGRAGALSLSHRAGVGVECKHSSGLTQDWKPVAHPFGALAGFAACTGEPGTAWFYGGQDDQVSNRLYRYDGAWKAIEIEGDRPPGKVGATLCWDEQRKVLVMFGGWSPSDAGRTYRYDLWEFDGKSWRSFDFSELEHFNNAPEHTHRPALWFDPTRGQVCILGGTGVKALDAGTLWSWDGKVFRRVTTQLMYDGLADGQRNTYHSNQPVTAGILAARLDDARVLLLSEIENRCWVWDGHAFAGRDLPAAWRNLRCAAVTSVENRLLLADGGGACWLNIHDHQSGNSRLDILADRNLGELQLGTLPNAPSEHWDATRGEWVEHETALEPSARLNAGVAYLTNLRKWVVFGGFDPNLNSHQPRNDTWLHDGTGWQSLDWGQETVTPPPATHHFAMLTVTPLANAVHEFVLLLGNEGDAVWWFKYEWTRTVVAGLPKLRAPVAVHDPANSRVLFFDGAARGPIRLYALAYEADFTPEFRVTEVAVAGDAPLARNGAVFTFDTRRNVAVLLSGQLETLADMNDLWEFDGTKWKHIAGQAVPLPPNTGVRWHSGGPQPIEIDNLRAKDLSGVWETPGPDGLYYPGYCASVPHWFDPVIGMTVIDRGFYFFCWDGTSFHVRRNVAMNRLQVGPWRYTGLRAAFDPVSESVLYVGGHPTSTRGRFNAGVALLTPRVGQRLDPDVVERRTRAAQRK